MSPDEFRSEFYNLYQFSDTTSWSSSQELILPEDTVEMIKQKFASGISKSQYMENNCKTTTYPKWEGFPLNECEYKVTDKNGIQKSAKVIMLNPSAEQLARWGVKHRGTQQPTEEEIEKSLYGEMNGDRIFFTAPDGTKNNPFS